MAAGVGTISIFENVNGQRGPQLFTKRIPLTPGPLVVTIKVASDQDPANASKFWPPNEDDQVETIAASCAYGLRRALTILLPRLCSRVYCVQMSLQLRVTRA